MDVGTHIETKSAQILVETTTDGKRTMNLRTFIRVCVRIYAASLVITGVAVPIAASVLTVSLYISPSSPLSLVLYLPQSWNQGWYSIVFGFIIICIVWLVVAALCWPFSTAKGANSRTYHLLKSRFHHLKSLGINELGDDPTLEDLQKAAIIDKKGGYNLLALKEAQAYYADLDQRLNGRISSTGLDWVTGMGYVTAWDSLHRAEEALIEVVPIKMVIHAAIHDKLAIQDSTINHRDELLTKLIQAVNDLDPKAAVYCKEHQPDKKSDELLTKLLQIVKKHNTGLLELMRAVEKVVPGVKIDVSAMNVFEDEEAEKIGTPAPDLETQARARVALREIRHSLNSFRDQLWEKILRARNKLLGAIALTGLFTHMLLSIVILTIPNASPSNQSIIVAVTAFYMVGAVAGLFERLYGESRTGTALHDYGLSLARLSATPLLSGLAGVGGVLITALLFTSIFGGPGTSSMPVTLQNVFSLQEPRYLLAAAIFGLAPNLIIRTLQQKAEKYVSGLQSSKGTDQEQL